MQVTIQNIQIMSQKTYLFVPQSQQATYNRLLVISIREKKNSLVPKVGCIIKMVVTLDYYKYKKKTVFY